MRIWSIRMTRLRVVLATIAVVAAFVALIWAIIAFTPMRQLLPGALKGDLRAKYLETALRLDSLEQAARINNAYLDNIVAIMSDDIPEDSVRAIAVEQIYSADSLLAATEAERLFVSRYEEEERFNLSVLAPIAAEGLIFTSPVASGCEVAPTGDVAKSIALSVAKNLPVSAIYRGTVVDVYCRNDGLFNVIVQHPNDFVSVYNGIGEAFANKGKKVDGGQALGQTPATGIIYFELWHNGSPLDSRDYIAF